MYANLDLTGAGYSAEMGAVKWWRSNAKGDAWSGPYWLVTATDAGCALGQCREVARHLST